jgi:polysaccharide export outer membrane protein
VSRTITLLVACCALWSALVTSPGSAAPTADSSYRLGSGDKLRITIYEQDKLSGDYTVDDGGRVSIPLLAPVPAAGLSTVQLEKAIANELRKTLIRDPNVTVQIVTFRPFFILGEVKQPGKYAFVPGMSVETAVAIAGGYTYRAKTNSAEISRPGPDGIEKLKVSADAEVRPGDTIKVTGRLF